MHAEKLLTGMPKATGAPPPKGFGPELPGRDPVGRATTMSSRGNAGKGAEARTQKATTGAGDGAQNIVGRA